MRRRSRTSRAFIFLDVLFALTIVVALAMGMAVATGRYGASVRRIHEAARATAEAERVLNELNLGRRPQQTPGYTFTMERIDADADAAPGAAASANGVWVRVTVTIDERSASLVGVVPGHMAGAVR